METAPRSVTPTKLQVKGWALGKTVEPEELKKHLQFLDNGMRGFYCVCEGTGTVALGDSVVIL